MKSIRARLAVGLGGTLAVTLTILCVLLIWQNYRQAQTLVADDLQRAGRLFMERLTHLEVKASAAARTAATSPHVVAALETKDTAALLACVLPIASIHEVNDLLVVDASGHLRASIQNSGEVNRPLPRINGISADRPITPVRGISIGVGEPAGLDMVATAPIERDGKYLGAIIARINLTNALLDDFRDVHAFEASLVTHSDASSRFQRAITSLNGGQNQRLRGSTVSLPEDGHFFIRLQNPDVLARYQTLRALDERPLWLEVATPTRMLAELQKQTVQTVVLVGFIALFGGSILAFVLARRITGPLTALRQAAEHLAEGNYAQEPIAVTSNDEVGYLAKTFNEMAKALQERDDRLQTFSRNLLQGQKALEYVNDRLKREKNEIETILNSSPEGVLVLDPQGHVVNANQAASMLIERRRSDILGHMPSEVLNFLDVAGNPMENVDAHLLEQHTLMPGEPLPSLEGFLPQRDESKIPVEIDSVPIQDEKRRHHGQVVIIRDITRKYEIDRLKEEFLAVITHQLKSPISALIGYAQILRESDTLSEEERDIIDNMKSLGEFLSLQIGNILASARLEANRMSYRVEHFPVATSFQDLARLFNPVARTRGIHLVIEDPGDQFMYADIEKVHDILGNLVNNALKFTPAGGTIRISATTDGDMVNVRVADTGKGIPADALPRLFQKFYQVTGEGHGTGLGLFIARTMVENMGGSIEVASVVREGTTFTVSLPRGNPTQARRAPPSAPTLSASVLVSEADRDMNAFVRVYLERQGVAHVRQAFNAADTRTLIERDRPDAVIIGEDLGDRTGFALAQDLKAHEETRDIPLIFVTGEPREDGDGLFAAQLTRPLEPAQLIEKLRDILRQHLQGVEPPAPPSGRERMAARAARVAEEP
ncbi:MAG: HAMP domain-containing protein [Armatimonadetes bacterium]|nr:HAMP domain-containing protein [Armatimonadota bacterium]